MQIQHFFDPRTSTLTYVVHDGRVAVVIDPVRNYDPKSARTSWRSSEEVAAYLEREKLTVPYVVDTHAHADHMTGLPFFKERHGAKSVTGARVGEAMATGVAVVACENTMTGQKLSKADMLGGIGYVPAGVVELMERQKQGYAYIRL